MSQVTSILQGVEQRDPRVAEQLLPLVYDELRRLAATRLAHERPGQTLDATSLVHEAYLRLVDRLSRPEFNSRGHFFAAAAEAMRRILVERARRRERLRHGGGRQREELPAEITAPVTAEEILALDEALDRLAQHDPLSAQLVKLRYFAGLTVQQSAEILCISPRKADFLWSFARAWLLNELLPD